MSRGNNAPWAPLSWWIRALYKSIYYYYYYFNVSTQWAWLSHESGSLVLGGWWVGEQGREGGVWIIQGGSLVWGVGWMIIQVGEQGREGRRGGGGSRLTSMWSYNGRGSVTNGKRSIGWGVDELGNRGERGEGGLDLLQCDHTMGVAQSRMAKGPLVEGWMSWGTGERGGGLDLLQCDHTMGVAQSRMAKGPLVEGWMSWGTGREGGGV